MVLWVFGYGSLVWNPGFQEEEKIVGYIKGYKRNFDLGCIDHRGTPQLPARTCALDADKESICWGTALCVSSGEDPEKERMVMEYLESRECEHDIKAYVDFYKEEEEEEEEVEVEGESALPFLTNVLVFTATPDKLINRYYLGPASREDTATQIARAAGPCGNNKDYLFKLEEAMVRIGHVDDFVIELANEVRKILAGTVPCS